jgi:hypothetical protein
MGCAAQGHAIGSPAGLVFKHGFIQSDFSGNEKYLNAS